jgi:hypothetical protein
MVFPLPPPTDQQKADAANHRDLRKSWKLLKVADVLPTPKDVEAFEQRGVRIIGNSIVRMAFAATSSAAGSRGISFPDPTIRMFTSPAAFAGFDDMRPLPTLQQDALKRLGALGAPAVYKARLSDFPAPVPLPVLFENMGTTEGTLRFLQHAQSNDLLPKILTDGAVVLDEDNSFELLGRGAQLIGGDSGTAVMVRRLRDLMSAEPRPTDRFDEVVTVHGPLHCQMEDVRLLGKPMFWGHNSQPGSIAWLVQQMQMQKLVKPDADNFHASMHFFADILLPSFIRAIIVRWYPERLEALAGNRAPAAADLGPCDNLAQLVVSDFLTRRNASPYVCDLLWWLVQIYDVRAAIRACQAEELTRCSRLAIPIYALQGARNYLTEEVLFQVSQLTLSEYLRECVSKARVVTSGGRLGDGKGFDHLWEELIKLCKGAAGNLGGEAVEEKLIVFSRNIGLLQRTDDKVRSLFGSGLAHEDAVPAAGAATGMLPRTLSAAEARTELNIRRCTNLILSSGVVEKAPSAPGEPDYRPSWLRELPARQGLLRLGMHELLARGDSLIEECVSRLSKALEDDE